MDRFDATKRSAIMRSVRSKETKPEMALRSALHARGLRFHLHAKLLAGRPDIVLPRWRACIVSAALGPYGLPVDGAVSVSAQHQGMSSSMRLLGQPLTRRVSRTVKYRWGSMPFAMPQVDLCA